MYIRSTELLGCFFSWSRLSPQYMTSVSTDGFFPFMPSRNFLRSNRSCHPLSSFHDSQGELGYLDGITPLDVVVAGAGAAGRGTGTAAASTFIAIRGKLKLPPASSITFTWQIYVPGFNLSLIHISEPTRQAEISYAV